MESRERPHRLVKLEVLVVVNDLMRWPCVRRVTATDVIGEPLPI